MDYVSVLPNPKIRSKGYHRIQEKDLRMDRSRLRSQAILNVVSVVVLLLVTLSLVSQLILQLNYQNLRAQFEQDLQASEKRIQEATWQNNIDHKVTEFAQNKKNRNCTRETSL